MATGDDITRRQREACLSAADCSATGSLACKRSARPQGKSGRGANARKRQSVSRRFSRNHASLAKSSRNACVQGRGVVVSVTQRSACRRVRRFGLQTSTDPPRGWAPFVQRFLRRIQPLQAPTTHSGHSIVGNQGKHRSLRRRMNRGTFDEHEMATTAHDFFQGDLVWPLAAREKQTFELETTAFSAHGMLGAGGTILQRKWALTDGSLNGALSLHATARRAAKVPRGHSTAP